MLSLLWRCSAPAPRAAVGGLVLLVSALPLAACSGSAEQGPSMRSVKLALNWYPEPEFGGFYEGVLGGHYEAAGFDVEILPGGPGAPTLQLLATGQTDVAITAADELLLQRNKGVKALGIWAAFQHSPQGIMVREDAGITTLAQLKELPDAKLAIEIGSPFHKHLWSAGGLEGKVAAVPYGGSVGPFLAGSVPAQQAYITSEPCVARAKGVDVAFIAARESGWNPYGTVVAVADPAPEWADEFVVATQNAWRAYLQDPARANAEIARQNPQLTAEQLDCVTQAQRPFVTGDEGLGSMSEHRWEDMARQLVAIELLSEGTRSVGAWKALWVEPR